MGRAAGTETPNRGGAAAARRFLELVTQIRPVQVMADEHLNADTAFGFLEMSRLARAPTRAGTADARQKGNYQPDASAGDLRKMPEAKILVTWNEANDWDFSC
jgi:hypothetical protein